MSPQSLLALLIRLGGRRSWDALGRLRVTIHKANVKKKNLPVFAQAIRRAAKYERVTPGRGPMLIPVRDQQGCAIGWLQAEKNRM